MISLSYFGIWILFTLWLLRYTNIIWSCCFGLYLMLFICNWCNWRQFWVLWYVRCYLYILEVWLLLASGSSHIGLWFLGFWFIALVCFESHFGSMIWFYLVDCIIDLCFWSQSNLYLLFVVYMGWRQIQLIGLSQFWMVWSPFWLIGFYLFLDRWWRLETICWFFLKLHYWKYSFVGLWLEVASTWICFLWFEDTSYGYASPLAPCFFLLLTCPEVYRLHLFFICLDLALEGIFFYISWSLGLVAAWYLWCVKFIQHMTPFHEDFGPSLHFFSFGYHHWFLDILVFLVLCFCSWWLTHVDMLPSWMVKRVASVLSNWVLLMVKRCAFYGFLVVCFYRMVVKCCCYSLGRCISSIFPCFFLISSWKCFEHLPTWGWLLEIYVRH